MTSEVSGRRILMPGSHRSGTTWVGEMLALSRGVHYVHEPFAPMYERAWVRTPTRHRYLHQPADARGPLDEDLKRIARLHPPWLTIARRARGVRNALRILEEAASTAAARRRGARALIKDPFALLMAEWIASRTGASVVVLVRHPAAFASSIKRLSWRLDVGWLLDQPSLMEGDLERFREELERDRAGTNDLLDHAALVWRALNTVVLRYERQHPTWTVIRYEDLAADPVSGVGELCRRVGVTWTPRMERLVRDRNAPRHGAEVTAGSKGDTRRDSRQAMWTWLGRLNTEEIDRVRASTAALASHWYPDDAWAPPSFV
jgi:hypothetical protein